jgi:hypothetical protein
MRAQGALLAKSDYLRVLLQATPVLADKLLTPLRGSEAAKWRLTPELAGTLKARPEWAAEAQAKLDSILAATIRVPAAPPVFLRALIHPSCVPREVQGQLAMPAEMLYIGRSAFRLHAEALLLRPGSGKSQRLPPELVGLAVANSADLGALVLFKKEYFSATDLTPGEVLAAAGTCLVGGVSAIYGPSAAIELLEHLCPLPAE